MCCLAVSAGSTYGRGAGYIRSQAMLPSHAACSNLLATGERSNLLATGERMQLGCWCACHLKPAPCCQAADCLCRLVAACWSL